MTSVFSLEIVFIILQRVSNDYAPNKAHNFDIPNIPLAFTCTIVVIF